MKKGMPKLILQIALPFALTSCYKESAVVFKQQYSEQHFISDLKEMMREGSIDSSEAKIINRYQFVSITSDLNKKQIVLEGLTYKQILANAKKYLNSPDYINRPISMPGDTIVMQNGKLFILPPPPPK